MGKRSISVTLEEVTIESLRSLADQEMRSVSNMIDYLVRLYTQEQDGTPTAKLLKAQEIASKTALRPYAETQAALRKNVFVDDADRSYSESAETGKDIG